MGFTDKISGRVKKAAGDLADDPSLKREGAVEERKAQKQDELAREQAQAEAADERARQKEAEIDRLDKAT